MCNFKALPGDPGYDQNRGMEYVIDSTRQDLIALQEGGVDAVMLSNGFSLSYLLKVKPITLAAMAHVITALIADIHVPYGVNVPWDPTASINLAVGASFVREIFSGVYARDFGLWNTNFGEVVRHQHRVGGLKIRLLFKIVPETAAHLAGRDIRSIAKSTVFNHRPDGLCVSGLTAGVQTDSSVLKSVKQAVPDTPVFANTGLRLENVEPQLTTADGGVVSTTFKQNAVFENPVDPLRVKAFMKKVKDFRRNYQ